MVFSGSANGEENDSDEESAAEAAARKEEARLMKMLGRVKFRSLPLLYRLLRILTPCL